MSELFSAISHYNDDKTSSGSCIAPPDAPVLGTQGMAGTVAGAILHSVLPSKDIKGESSGYLVIIEFLSVI